MRNPRNVQGLKPKDLIGIPWRVALALQADGWYLRSAPPWIKRSAMPESVRDRATTAHEFWFQLAKSKRYYWDAEAVRVGWADKRNGRAGGQAQHYNSGRPDGHTRRPIEAPAVSGRNRRTSDTWNESLDARIAFYRDQLAHLEHVREHGGILLDEGGGSAGAAHQHVWVQGCALCDVWREADRPADQGGEQPKRMLPKMQSTVAKGDNQGNATATRPCEQ